MFHSHCNHLISSLRAENADLLARIAKDGEERQKLIDRILALTSPSALNQVSPPPRPVSAAPKALSQDDTSRRIHWPGTDFARGSAPDPRKNTALFPPSMKADK